MCLIHCCLSLIGSAIVHLQNAPPVKLTVDAKGLVDLLGVGGVDDGLAVPGAEVVLGVVVPHPEQTCRVVLYA